MRAKIDGNPQPKDWMVASPERDALRQDVDDMIELLGLLRSWQGDSGGLGVLFPIVAGRSRT